MKDSTIEDLAYQIKEAKDNNKPKPIVFLGAGASKTGGIPSADGIVEDILKRYKKNPRVKALKKEERDYPTLMNCLTRTLIRANLRNFCKKLNLVYDT